MDYKEFLKRLKNGNLAKEDIEYAIRYCKKYTLQEKRFFKKVLKSLQK